MITKINGVPIPSTDPVHNMTGEVLQSRLNKLALMTAEYVNDNCQEEPVINKVARLGKMRAAMGDEEPIYFGAPKIQGKRDWRVLTKKT